MITHQYNLNTGSLLDRFGNVTTGSNVSFDRKKKGLALLCNGINGKFELGDIGNVKSLAFWINLKNIVVGKPEEIFEGDPNAHLILASAGTLSYPDFDNAFVDGIDTDTITTGWHLLIVTSTTDVACSDAVLALNNAAFGEFWCSKIIVYDHELTSNERSKLMSDFNSASNITKSIDVPLTYPRPVDLSGEAGIVAAYNGILSPGGIAVDIGGGGNNGTATDVVTSKDGFVFNGETSIIPSINLQDSFGDNGAFTIAMRIKPYLANNNKAIVGISGLPRFYIRDSTTWGLGDTVIIMTGLTFEINQWINLIAVYAPIEGKMKAYKNGILVSNIDYSGDGDMSSSIITMGGYAASPFYGEIVDMRFYNVAKDLQFAKDYHNKFARRISQKIALEEGVGSTIG